MRLRELESKTGVGRETIRFYIREGLLPEPDRVSRNSAFYSDDHVTRVRAIKRLQEERFLPLGVIKTLLDAEDGDRWLHAGAFPEIDSLLRLRLDGTAPRLSRDEVIAQTGCQPDQFDEAVTLGTVTLDSGGRIAHIQNALFAPDLANQRRQSLLHALDDAERDLAMDAGAHHGESDGPARRVRRVSSIADLRAALGPNDTVVEYAIIDDAATAFIVSGDRLTIVPITTPVDLTDRVSFFVRALEDNARDASIASGRALAERLLDPVLPLLPEGARVLIVAAGALARLPFAALPVVDAAGRPVPLMTRNEVTYLPSLTLFARRRAAGSGALDASVLAVADAVTPEAHSRSLAPLPASRIEAERAASYGSRSQLLAGAGATEQAVKLAASNKYSVVHLATHALLDPVVPERSAVLLGASGDDDGLLQSREIYELPLNGSLIVLSGCRTADGQISGAEGLRSLSRAFLQAGGRAVVGALWDLPDAGAERIVTVFYQTLEDGASAGAALRQAQLSAAGSDPYAVTRTWASMVILGDSSLQINTKGRRPTFTIAAAGFALILITSLAWRRRVRRESRGLYRR